MKSEIMYIELVTGYSHNGPAWIGKVKISRTGRTVYFNNKALKKIKNGGISSNHYDLETSEEYWISGVKKNGGNRHWAGNGKIMIDEKIVDEYLSITGWNSLDSRFELCTMLETKTPQDFYHLENEKL
jgi:hypothetical protein